MDPLSVMASVVGLLTAAGTVSSILSSIKSGISDAPRLMEHVLSEVKEVEISLSAMQKFLIGIGSAPIRRIALIQVDQLVATLTESVLTFSELEALIKPLEARSEISLRDRVKWAWKEDTVLDIMQRLQRHKSSLSLMLNIVQCESDFEAEQSRAELQNLVERLLESNQDISRRLRSLEDRQESRGTLTGCFSHENNDRLAKNDEVEAATITARRWSADDPESNRINFNVTASHFTFESDLITSRVYQRTRLYEADASFTTSIVRTHAWSIFSGLSLAEVSAISAIALPLYLYEISNNQWYNLGETIKGAQNGKIAHNEATSLISTKRNASGDESTSVAATAENQGPNSLNISFSPLEPLGISQASRLSNAKDMTYKLVVLGDGGVGKTQLTTQLYYKRYDELYDPTIEDSYSEEVIIDGDSGTLEVLDTAGVEEYAILWEKWIGDGDGFVLVYSITSRSSFTNVTKFFQLIRKEKGAPALSITSISAPCDPSWRPIMLVGSKSDRVAEREVSTQEGHALARELGCSFVEASAKNNVNVEKAFYDVVRLIRVRRRLLSHKNLGSIESQRPEGSYAKPKIWQRIRAKNDRTVSL